MFIKLVRLTWISILCCCVFLASCATTPPQTAKSSVTPASTLPATKAPTATATATPTPVSAPKSYTSRVLLRGVGRPDDLVFNAQGQLLFSDFYAGTISRVNMDGTATVLLRGIDGPEGMVALPDGTLIVAEQRTNSILAFAPGASAATTLRKLPGTPSTVSCKDGVDGIALDPATNTLIIPDSPTGDVYHMSMDGKTLTLLAAGIVRPVGATADAQGNIYVADECGGAVWRIAPGGSKTRIGGFGMPDDVVLDSYDNMFVIDLALTIHSLIRMNLASGQRSTIAQQGFIEPQGLVIDRQGHIFVSDDYANMIVEFSPA